MLHSLVQVVLYTLFNVWTTKVILPTMQIEHLVCVSGTTV